MGSPRCELSVLYEFLRIFGLSCTILVSKSTADGVHGASWTLLQSGLVQ